MHSGCILESRHLSHRLRQNRSRIPNLKRRSALDGHGRSNGLSEKSRGRVVPSKQVTHGFAPEQRPPTAALMFRPVVVHVASLAERGEVRVGVVGCVVIPMGGCQHYTGRANGAEILDRRQGSECSSPSVAPSADRGIPPASIPQAVDCSSMRSPAGLAGPARPLEANRR